MEGGWNLSWSRYCRPSYKQTGGPAEISEQKEDIYILICMHNKLQQFVLASCQHNFDFITILMLASIGNTLLVHVLSMTTYN